MKEFKIYGIDIVIEKEHSTKQYVAKCKYGGFLICKARTKKECGQKALSLFTENGEKKSKLAYKNTMRRRIKTKMFRKFDDRLSKLFKFGLPFCRTTYMINNELALDVILLDSKLRVPENVSTHDFIKEKYGEKVLKIVKKLI